MKTIPKQKKCAKCFKEKELNCFGVSKSNKDGFKSYCKECLVLIEKDRRSRDPEGMRARDKAWREANLEKRKAHERKAGLKRRSVSEHRQAESESRHKIRLEKHKSEKSDVVCVVCGVHFCPLFGKHSWVTTCSDGCRKLLEAKRIRIKVSIYRARKKSTTVSRIDPIDILMRDGWTCQICGRKTPKKLRGTTKNNAPELDHRIPLSKGGSHTLDNVQCACRKCNGVKSNKSNAGQMNLFNKYKC